jgi:ammonia channel protein AmtB
MNTIFKHTYFKYTKTRILLRNIHQHLINTLTWQSIGYTAINFQLSTFTLPLDKIMFLNVIFTYYVNKIINSYPKKRLATFQLTLFPS